MLSNKLALSLFDLIESGFNRLIDMNTGINKCPKKMNLEYKVLISQTVLWLFGTFLELNMLPWYGWSVPNACSELLFQQLIGVETDAWFLDDLVWVGTWLTLRGQHTWTQKTHPKKVSPVLLWRVIFPACTLKPSNASFLWFLSYTMRRLTICSRAESSIVAVVYMIAIIH